MKIGQCVRLGWLSWKMFWKYGPKLVGLGLKIYRKVEDLSDRSIVAVTEMDKDIKVEFKQNAFADLLGSQRGLWKSIMGKGLTDRDVEKFREEVWERMNPGKRPRRVSGKTRKRR